jgi:hypothetical protein
VDLRGGILERQMPNPKEESSMYARYRKALIALAAAGVIAVPAVAQARGGSDDPPSHEQREHRVRHEVRHHGVHSDRRERRHDRVDNDRRDGRGSDDGLSHR